MLSNNTEVALEAWDQEHQEMNLLDWFNGILIQPLHSTREICWGIFCHLNRRVLHFCNLDSTVLSPSIRTSFSNYSVDPNSYSFQNSSKIIRLPNPWITFFPCHFCDSTTQRVLCETCVMHCKKFSIYVPPLCFLHFSHLFLLSGTLLIVPWLLCFLTFCLWNLFKAFWKFEEPIINEIIFTDVIFYVQGNMMIIHLEWNLKRNCSKGQSKVWKQKHLDGCTIICFIMFFSWLLCLCDTYFRNLRIWFILFL